MKIYHGSYLPIEKPRIISSERTLDFGQGFYATTNYEQAKEWARKVANRRREPDAYISFYEFDIEAAKKSVCMKIFNSADESWLDYVSACRAGKSWQDDYDIVSGPVADDDVYTTLILYERGILEKTETLRRLKVKKLFNQVLFHTENSLKYCEYINSEKLR